MLHVTRLKTRCFSNGVSPRDSKSHIYRLCTIGLNRLYVIMRLQVILLTIFIIILSYTYIHI